MVKKQGATQGARKTIYPTNKAPAIRIHLAIEPAILSIIIATIDERTKVRGSAVRMDSRSDTEDCRTKCVGSIVGQRIGDRQNKTGAKLHPFFPVIVRLHPAQGRSSLKGAFPSGSCP